MIAKRTMLVLAILAVLHGTYAEEAPMTLQNAKVEDLSGLFGFRRECLGEKHLADIISANKASENIGANAPNSQR